MLPISTKNMLAESKILTFIQRWAQTKSILQPAEMDGYSSENTSRAQTPLNTPDGTSSKLGQELDGDSAKPVYPRHKIISENSLDSALSDASKASDGKEEEDDEEEEEEEESSNANGKLVKADPGGEAAEAEAADVGGEAAEAEAEAADPGAVAADPGGEAAQPGIEAAHPGIEAAQPEIEAAQPEIELAVPTKGLIEDPVEEENREDPDLNSDTLSEEDRIERGLEQITVEVEVEEVSTEGHLDFQEMPKVDHKELESGEEQLKQTVSEMTDLEGNQPDIEPEGQPMQVDAVDVPPQNDEMETTKQEADKAAPGNEEQPGETSTHAMLISEAPEVCVPSEVSQATPAEPSVIGTPSQDEEEGVSDVESERSQEPQLNVLDVSAMASRLLESWKDLKVKSD